MARPQIPKQRPRQNQRTVKRRTSRPTHKSKRTRSARSWLPVWIGLVVVAVAVVIVIVAVSGRNTDSASIGAPFVGGDLHSLVVDPQSPSRLFVGGHQGVAVSNNAGHSWRPVASLTDRNDPLGAADAMAWAFAGNKVTVGGHPGLFISTDGGKIFMRQNEGLPATDIHALGASSDGSVIYAGSPQLGVFVSPDGGNTWQIRSRQVGQAFMGSILVDPKDVKHVVAPDMKSGAVESRDGGTSWQQLNSPVQGVTWVSWDPTTPAHIVASGMSGAAETSNAGASWQTLDIPEGATIVQIDPSNPAVMYAAAHDGDAAKVWVSRDGAKSWKRP